MFIVWNLVKLEQKNLFEALTQLVRYKFKKFSCLFAQKSFSQHYPQVKLLFTEPIFKIAPGQFVIVKHINQKVEQTLYVVSSRLIVSTTRVK